jgi:hypothetical protein
LKLWHPSFRICDKSFGTYANKPPVFAGAKIAVLAGKRIFFAASENNQRRLEKLGRRDFWTRARASRPKRLLLGQRPVTYDNIVVPTGFHQEETTAKGI